MTLLLRIIRRESPLPHVVQFLHSRVQPALYRAFPALYNCCNALVIETVQFTEDQHLPVLLRQLRNPRVQGRFNFPEPRLVIGLAVRFPGEGPFTERLMHATAPPVAVPQKIQGQVPRDAEQDR